MGMLEKPKKKIGRGAKVEVENKVSLNDIKTLEDDLSVKEVGRVTIPVNIRVDNHVRNAIASLVNLGKFETAKDFVEWAIDKYLDEELNPDELKGYEYIRDTMEVKDFEKENRKKEAKSKKKTNKKKQ